MANTRRLLGVPGGGAGAGQSRSAAAPEGAPDVSPSREAADASQPLAEVPPPTVRMLLGEAELAEAVARAAESDRRRRDLLDARAARDAWMAERTEERVGWRRMARAR